MPCNCRQGISSHNHLGDTSAKDGTGGLGLLINDAVDLSRLQIWNSTSSAREAQRLFDPKEVGNTSPVCSDSDAEMLILAPFSSICRIRGISIVAPCSDFAPRHVKLFVNFPDIRGFDSVRRLQAQEEIELAQTSLDDRILYKVNPMKFLSVGCLAFFFEHSYNDEETHLLRVDIFGENSGISTNPNVATNISYEVRPNPADHPCNEEVKHFLGVSR